MTTFTTDTGHYHLYGIVPATTVLPAGETTARLIPYGSVAALVAGPLAAPPQTTRAALLDHAAQLDRLAPVTAVLPVRFGTVLTGVDEVVAMLAEHADEFETALRMLRGRTQYTVKAHLVREAVLLEIADTRPDVAQLRDRLAGNTEPAYYERIRLGELVAQALAATAEADAVLLWDTLTPHAVAAVPRAVTGPERPFGGAFLVENDHRAAFEAAAEELAGWWRGRARVRLLGPLAAYDFVASTDRTD